MEGDQNNIENRKLYVRLRDWIKILQRDKKKKIDFFGLDFYRSLKVENPI